MYRADTPGTLQSEGYKQCSLIVNLFNLYLPSKIEVGGNIWRFIVFLTSDKTLDGKTEVVGLCQDSYVFCDSKKLIGLNTAERKDLLLKLFIKGLEACCNACDFSFEIFSKIEKKIVKDEIAFDDLYKERKISPNRIHSAQMKGYLSEYLEELSIILFDKSGLVTKTISIGNFDFRQFDRIKWVDEKTLNVYQINFIQSYKRKKVAADYFSVDIKSEEITYVPVTREREFLIMVSSF